MSAAPYSVYGTGTSLLFAFHGYGMDGYQFQVLEGSLCKDYHIIGFHLPYHKGGPDNYDGWIELVRETIKKILEEKGVKEIFDNEIIINEKVYSKDKLEKLLDKEVK